MLEDELSILVVDDNEQHASVTEKRLEESTEYISADYVTSAKNAISLLEEQNFDTIVADYDMPGMNGLELTDHVSTEYDIPVIMYTGCGSESVATEAFRRGAEDYVCKGSPNTFAELANRVENAAIGYRTEEELEIFKKSVDDAGHAIKITDSEGKLIYVNSAFEKVSGYSEEEVLGEPAKIVRSGEHDDEFYQEMWDTILDGEMWDEEILNEDKNGDRYWVNQTIHPIENQSGEIKYFIAVNKDITRGKKDRKFKEVVNSLLRHDTANNQQLMTARAELALSKLAEIETEELPEAQQQIYEEARRNLEEVDDLINENIDLVKEVRNILGDFAELDTEPTSLANQVNEAIDEAQVLAARTGVNLETNVENYTIIGGPLMNRMIYNSIENSITHPEDHELVSVSSERIESEKGDILLRVSDDGEGFPEEFSLQRGVSAETSEGTGMGTWLSSEIADSLGIEMETGESDMGGAEYRFFMEEWGENK